MPWRWSSRSLCRLYAECGESEDVRLHGVGPMVRHRETPPPLIVDYGFIRVTAHIKSFTQRGDNRWTGKAENRTKLS